MKRIVIFVDGSNFGAALKAAGYYVDYQKMREYFASFGDLVGSYYFTALPPAGETSGLRSFVDALSNKGWNLVTKETKEFFDTEGSRLKGNMDVELVVKAFVIAPHITDLILCSGDGDFRAMVEELQNRGVRVTAISHEEPGVRNMIARELRTQVNEFIALRDIRGHIESLSRPTKIRRV